MLYDITGSIVNVFHSLIIPKISCLIDTIQKANWPSIQHKLYK